MDKDDEEDDWSWPLVCVLPSVLENEMEWEHPSPMSHQAPFIRSMGWPQNHWSSLSVRHRRRMESRGTYTGALKTKGAAVRPWRDVIEAFAAGVERISGTTVRVGVVCRFPLRMWSGAVAPGRGRGVFSLSGTQTTLGGDFDCQCPDTLGWPRAPQ